MNTPNDICKAKFLLKSPEEWRLSPRALQEIIDSVETVTRNNVIAQIAGAAYEFANRYPDAKIALNAFGDAVRGEIKP